MTDYLGPYRLGSVITGDVLDVLRQLPDACVDLVIADPPYFKVAEGDWDHQWESVDEWADWCLSWAAQACRVLKDNGSAYLFGDDKNIAYMQVRTDKLPWGLLNSIVWSKTNYTMLKADPDAMRSYRPQGEERILFYGKDVRTFNEVVVPMSAAPMAEYITQERERAGLSPKQVAAAFPSRTGGLTGCVTNWEKGFNFPTPEVYAKLREVLNTQGRNPNGSGEYLRRDYEYLRRDYEELRRDYEELRRDYEELRRDYEELRRPFTGGRFTDVWTGPLMPGPAKRHECEKPQWLVRRMVESSSKAGAVVLDLFSGSGATSEACIQLGRRYLAVERNPEDAQRARQRCTVVQPAWPEMTQALQEALL